MYFISFSFHFMYCLSLDHPSKVKIFNHNTSFYKKDLLYSATKLYNLLSRLVKKSDRFTTFERNLKQSVIRKSLL